VKRSAGPFEILEILGEGSFGTVCVARVSTDPLRRKVALKILKGAYATNEKILNRTRDEARLLSAINHPNIVRVERLMEIAGRPVVVMEHVQGVSLDQLLLRFKEGLPGAIALEVIRQTCLALHVAYAEALGDDGRPLRVIHRDIKPSNIMLSIHGEVKVLDFGIARGDFEGREARTESVVMGSRPYMAPERLDGINDSQAVDVYSAGMSLFELLTGKPMTLSINPVNHDQAMNRQLQYVHIEGMSNPKVDDLRDLVRRMCSYTRDYRPSAAECARDLQQLQYGMDQRYHIALDEFAQSTVAPIYDSRKRVTPEDAVPDDATDPLREFTDAAKSGHHVAPLPRTNWAPYAFVGVLGFVVVLMSTLATVQWLLTEDLQRVEIWIPLGATATYGGEIIVTPSEVRVPPGPKRFTILLENTNRTLVCMVDAERSIRWIGEDSISVDNSPVAQVCREAELDPRGALVNPPSDRAPRDAPIVQPLPPADRTPQPARVEEPAPAPVPPPDPPVADAPADGGLEAIVKETAPEVADDPPGEEAIAVAEGPEPEPEPEVARAPEPRPEPVPLPKPRAAPAPPLEDQ